MNEIIHIKAYIIFLYDRLNNIANDVFNDNDINGIQ